MTSRKKILLTAGGIAVTAVIAGVMTAYFASRDDEPNLITIGEDKIVVTEAFTPPSQTDTFKYRKLVKIQNTGSVPCYIRVRLEFSNSTVANAASFSAANPDSDTPPADSTFKSAQIQAGSDYYINNLPDRWVYVWEEKTVFPSVTNGYYYYTRAVAPEQATNALISWIWMNYNGEEVQAHDLYVYSESVQTIDPNTGTAYTDWKAAWHSFAG